MNNLTTEQEFKLAHFRVQVEKMTKEQMQELLLKSFKDMMIKDNYHKELIKKQWGL